MKQQTETTIDIVNFGENITEPLITETPTTINPPKYPPNVSHV
jgi:hypothetical protein